MDQNDCGDISSSWWRPHADTPSLPLMVCGDAQAARAHAEVAAAAWKERNSSAVLIDDAKAAALAPWMALELRRCVRHLVVVSNARVLEVHVGDTADIQTHEGSLVVEGLFLHNVQCNADAGQALKLKFFARKPKYIIDLVAVCLVCDAATPNGGGGGDSNKMDDAMLTVEDRLRRLEAVMQMSMQSVMTRLRAIEGRLDVLERRDER